MSRRGIGWHWTQSCQWRRRRTAWYHNGRIVWSWRWARRLCRRSCKPIRLVNACPLANCYATRIDLRHYLRAAFLGAKSRCASRRSAGPVGFAQSSARRRTAVVARRARALQNGHDRHIDDQPRNPPTVAGSDSEWLWLGRVLPIPWHLDGEKQTTVELIGHSITLINNRRRTRIEEDDGLEAGVFRIVHLNVPQRFHDFIHDANPNVVNLNLYRAERA